MKKNVYLWLALFAAALVFGFLGWAFSQHGTIGLFRVNGTFHLLFIVLAVFGVVLLGLAVFEHRLRSRAEQRTTHILSIFVRILTLLGIVVPVFAFIYTGAFGSSMQAAGFPQLLMQEGTGINGVPDLAVVFNTQDDTSNILTWGSGDSSVELNEAESSQQHVFLLNDLQPDMEYWYQVNEDRKYYFTTPPVSGAPLHFAVFSDAHFGYGESRSDISEKMLEFIADPVNEYSLLFSLGDLVDHGFKDSQWQTAFQSLYPATSLIPTKFTLGNHETLLGGLKYFEAYCYPDGMPLQSGTKLYQRIDVGDIHFLVVDIEWSAETYTAAQAKWLEAQLSGIPEEDWTIVIGHGFYYASGLVLEGWNWYDNPETIEKLTPLFEQYDVDIVFSGHLHQLELLENEGVNYIICGTFGGKLEHEREYVSPASEWYSCQDYAFVDVEIEGEEAAVVFRDPDGQEIHSFVITK